HGEGFALPVERRVVHDAIVPGGIDFAGVRVILPQSRAVVNDDVLVLLTNAGTAHVGRPVAVPLRGKRIGGGRPGIELARHRDAPGKGSPDPESDPARINVRAHARARRCWQNDLLSVIGMPKGSPKLPVAHENQRGRRVFWCAARLVWAAAENISTFVP